MFAQESKGEKQTTKKQKKKQKREKLILGLIKKFNSQFKTEKDCQEKINRMLYPDGNYYCRECKSQNIENVYGERHIKCLDCKKTTSLTAYTFFHRVRSARAYLAPIWIMEQGIILNASEIARVSNVVNSTGQFILKKLTFVIKSKMEELNSTLASEQFSTIICKRSKETPKRQHPTAEIPDSKYGAPKEAIQSQAQISVETKIVNAPFKQFSKSERKILKVLSKGPVQLEDLQNSTSIPTSILLPCLTMLELNGTISRAPGDQYKAVPICNTASACHTDPKSKNSTTSGIIPQFKLKKTIQFVKNLFHGISRKYLQLYCAAIWVHVDKQKWDQEVLLKACCSFGDIDPRTIYNYVSQYVVKAVIIT